MENRGKRKKKKEGILRTPGVPSRRPNRQKEGGSKKKKLSMQPKKTYPRTTSEVSNHLGIRKKKGQDHTHSKRWVRGKRRSNLGKELR